MFSSLYEQYEHAADAILNRTQLKTRIVQQITEHPNARNHFFITSPSGAGAFSFAKSCLNAAGYTKPIVFDALDTETNMVVEKGAANGQCIQQSLYVTTKKKSYIYKDGANIGNINTQAPTFFLAHSSNPVVNPVVDPVVDQTFIELTLPTQTQFEQLFYLYTGDSTIGKAEFTRLFHDSPAFGHLHILMRLVLLYRTNIQHFNSCLSHLSKINSPQNSKNNHKNKNNTHPHHEKTDDIENNTNHNKNNPHYFSKTRISTLYQKYTQSTLLPTMEQLYTKWPLYTTNTWRCVLPQYASISRLFTFPFPVPPDLGFSFVAHSFQKIPGCGKGPLRDEYTSFSKTPVVYMNSVILYSVYSFQTPREDLEYLFRRIYNAYFHLVKSDKNKITSKTKKIGLERARKEIFRESFSWNEKLFRKWIYYTAQFTL